MINVARALAALTALVALALPAHAGDRRFGLMVDAGVPEGASGSFVYRPFSFLRLHAGGGYNLVAPGVRAGLSLIPLRSLGLSANVEAGRAFTGDATGLARTLTGKPDIEVASLRSVGYDYANFRVGLETGRDVVTFYIHGGMSYIRGTVKDAGMTFSSIGDSTTFTFNGDPRVSIWSASVRVGLIVYFMR